MWRSVETRPGRKPRSSTVCAQQRFCVGTCAAFSFRSGDMNDVQLIDLGSLSSGQGQRGAR